MLLSLRWLREFTPYEGTAEELGARLTMLGLELEELRHPCREMEETLIGRVLECVRHPNADHLSLCRVDTGAPEPAQIVCGAPNVAAGQHVVVAPEGSSLPGGLRIKKAKIRGELSQGMICSERELGLSDEHDGILVLEDDILQSGGAVSFKPGMKATEALRLDTEVLDISVTPNRPDCLSVLGLAREIALAFGLPLRLPLLEREGLETDASSLESMRLEVESGEISPFYQLRLITGLSARRGPAWMRWRLRACGQRAIYNLVDVTNYIMLELGQPLHSFDFDKVRGGLVRVALAGEGETLSTLDGQERSLTASDITIRDAHGPIGLAGVMGGAGTAVHGGSRAVLLEGAVFDPSRIRRTARRLSLPSEAAYRFERGVDQGLAAFALERAALLIADLGGGRMERRPLHLELKPLSRPAVSLRRARAESLIGVPLEDDFCLRALTGLGCAVRAPEQRGRGGAFYAMGSAARAPEQAGDAGCDWLVTPPSWRHDLEREADLIEELARVYGVDRVPESLPKVSRPLEKAGHPEPLHKFLTRVKFWAAGAGLNEAINYSFIGHKDLDFLGLPQEGRVSLLNPLNADLDVLRPAVFPGLLNSLRHNLAQSVPGLRLFEVASAFSRDAHSPYGTGVGEDPRLGLLFYGERHRQGWPFKSEDADYSDLKGCAEALAQWLGLPAPEFDLEEPDASPWFAPAVVMRVKGERAGFMGRLKTDLARACHARKAVWLGEFFLDKLRSAANGGRASFTPLPAYPAVRRDITVMAPPDMRAGSMAAAIRDCRPEHMETFFLLDVYQPEGSAERHLTWRLIFRHPAGSLLDAEVDKTRDKVAEFLRRRLAVRI
ncbi:MAG: phenylalanine--tRNA ligase subunit beta [Deltaproteobacteria bacterium]|jgi:phenylalanyl-tRNA synthetase beta chain|nr:phenylalanine--tRNA ligase subunit beta [Deltaproteobacteria bacterium]